ncbi:hypothetical protein BN982_02896 [Halobacillus karajensis]|uniref:Uncharacterized protein n=1 Tax=Halobacillus karajensis TaxID=195088 RepID=A0A024P522_9BACI|nr:hypothetical protein BN982_02896 [Halobacillus karajensis]CDQ23980.1 hypothetical protein BN983_02241 [Halobacillus karajensis]CDQ27458.1 hypothetical protein BN981_01722 [Halobacillus karajensis]
MTKPLSNAFALIPFAIFIFLFIGSGIVTGDFYQMPVLVALFIAILAALAMNRKTDFQTKVSQLRASQHYFNGHYIPACWSFRSRCFRDGGCRIHR